LLDQVKAIEGIDNVELSPIGPSLALVH